MLGWKVGSPLQAQERDRKNPLFPIHHTLAQMRDNVSRLVHHLWLWICWRSYVRGVTNAAPRTTPARIVGAAGHQLGRKELLREAIDVAR